MLETYLNTSNMLWTSWLNQTCLCRLCENEFIVFSVNVVGALLANRKSHESMKKAVACWKEVW